MKSAIMDRIRNASLATLFVTAGLAAGAGSAYAADACTEVKVMGSAGPETDALVKYAALDFEKASGIKANIDIVARDMQGQRESAEFVADAGQYDVVLIGGPDDKLWVGRAHSVDLRKILPEKELANIVPRVKELATMDDGKLMAVPQYWNAPMYFYRKDLFADAKTQGDFKAKYGYDLAPPDTWEHLADIAEFFDHPPNLYGGFVDGVAWASIYDYYNVLYGLGGDFSDLKANKMTLNSPESVKALTLLQRVSKTAPPGYQTQSFFDADKLVQAGKLAAYWNWSYIWTTLAKQPDKFAMAAPPGKGVHSGGFWLAIPEAAPHPACAAKFLSWVLSDDFQLKQMATTGNPAATTSANNNKEVTSKIPDFDAYLATESKLMIEDVTWSRELSEGVSAALADVYAGKKTPQQAADWLQNEKFKDRKPME